MLLMERKCSYKDSDNNDNSNNDNNSDVKVT